MSGYRPLVPSGQQLQSQSSASPEGSEQIDPINSELAPIGTDVQPTDVGFGVEEEGYKKRRIPLAVSQRACNECRHSRQRCDGERATPQEPQRNCTRCTQKHLYCVFEESTKELKEDLIKQMRFLKETNDALRSELDMQQGAAIVLQEQQDAYTTLFKKICHGHNAEHIIQRLRDGQSHLDVATWMHRMPSALTTHDGDPYNVQTLKSALAAFEEDCKSRGDLQFPEKDLEALTSWTSVTSEVRLIVHLLDLYFAYVHPVHMLFSEADFRRSFHNRSGIHCSKSLLNAVCAMACYVYETQGQPSGTSDFQGTTTAVMRRAFTDECKSSMVQANLQDLTSIQAFGVMFLIELSAGKTIKAVAYLRVALENFSSETGSRQSTNSQYLTCIGLQVLRTFCLEATSFSLWEMTHGLHTTPSEEFLKSDLSVVRMYSRMSGGIHLAESTYTILTAYHLSRLFMVVAEAVKIYEGFSGPITAVDIHRTYKMYLEWEGTLPSALKHFGDDERPLPHVISLKVQYHTAIVQLLCPMTRVLRSQDKIEICELVMNHAWKGLETLKLLHELYSCRFSTAALAFCVVYLCDAILLQCAHSQSQYSKGDAVHAAKLGLYLLGQMRLGLPLCGPLQKSLANRAGELGIPIPDPSGRLERSLVHVDLESMLDACTRHGHVPPMSRIMSRIDPAIADEWRSVWRGHRTGSVASLLNED